MDGQWRLHKHMVNVYNPFIVCERILICCGKWSKLYIPTVEIGINKLIYIFIYKYAYLFIMYVISGVMYLRSTLSVHTCHHDMYIILFTDCSIPFNR